jgi:hypothetical protein
MMSTFISTRELYAQDDHLSGTDEWRKDTNRQSPHMFSPANICQGERVGLWPDLGIATFDPYGRAMLYMKGTQRRS